jgi:hypothetical protein
MKRFAVRPSNVRVVACFILKLGGGVAVDLHADADLDNFRCFPSHENSSLYFVFLRNPTTITMTKDFPDCKPCRGAKAGR